MVTFRKHSYKFIQAILCLGLTGMFYSCGDDSSAPQLNPRELAEGEAEANPESGGAESETETDENIENYGLANVDWEFGCDKLVPVGKPESTSLEDNKLVGFGDQKIALDGTTRLNLQFSGSACLPTNRVRHILFAVSVARAMDDADPGERRTCARLTAVTSALTRLEASPLKDSTRVGYITFDDRIRSQSPRMVTLAQFRANYLDDDIFCDQNNRPTTSYDIGLSTASDQFTAAAVGVPETDKVSREIYLITNQEPRNSVDGFGMARNLVTKMEVSINTIMVGLRSSQVADGIASRDNDNKPLHANVEAMGALSGMLLQMTEKVIVDASVEVANLGVKPIAWTRLPLVDDLYKGFISADASDITKRTYKEGLGVRINIWDSHGRSETQESTLSFE